VRVDSAGPVHLGCLLPDARDRRSRRRHLKERSRILGWIRLAAVYAFIAALVYLSRPTPALFAVGAALALTGEAIRIWAAGHLTKSVRLVTSGPYAYTQNPLYLGRLLILTGLAIAARMPGHLNLVALALGYAVFFFYYIPRKLRVEGGRLARLHGEAFEEYHRRVPILVPRLRRHPGGLEAWSFRLMVSNQEPLVLTGVALVLALLAWKTANR
jgi:protein-S-isoprenylcysteine O-methyltransferase Ste14